MSENQEPEFSRPFPVEDLREEAGRRIEATEAERTALARRLDVASVNGLTADLQLARELGAIIRLRGEIMADITQTCVVTLAPLESHLVIDVDRRYGPPEVAAGTGRAEEDIDPEDEDPPDVITEGVIDLGEAVTELLSVDVDPFPRVEGAEFQGFASDTKNEDSKESPFAVLEGLVKKPK